jgi:hypothetical protein
MIEEDGVLDLINRGMISKDVDIGPAFTKVNPPIVAKPLPIHNHHMKKFQSLNYRDKEIQYENHAPDLIIPLVKVTPIQPKRCTLILFII